MKGFIVSAIAVLALIQLVVELGQAAITYGQVNGFLASCIPYLTCNDEPTAACCSGMKNLVWAITNTIDKREACKCTKEAANHFSVLKVDATQALPGKCGVKMDIPISKNVNCDMQVLVSSYNAFC